MFSRKHLVLCDTADTRPWSEIKKRSKESEGMTAVKCEENRSDCNSNDERERPGPSGTAEEREK